MAGGNLQIRGSGTFNMLLGGNFQYDIKGEERAKYRKFGRKFISGRTGNFKDAILRMSSQG